MHSSPDERSLRVAMLSSDKDRCGIAAYAHVLGDALAKRGVDVRWVALDAARRKRPDFVHEVRAEIEALRPHVVHVQHEYSFFGGLMPPMGAGATLFTKGLVRVLHAPFPAPSMFFDVVRDLDSPLVVTLHELPYPEPPTSLGVRMGLYASIVRCANKMTFDAADVVITHSDMRRQDLLSLGLPPEKVRVGLLAIPPAPPMPPRDDARRDLDVEGRFVLLTVGFLVERKGVEHMIRALELLPERALLVIVGDEISSAPTGYRARLERVVAERNLRARVRFTGFLDEPALAPWLAAADAYALTHVEMGGASAALAMGISAGLPVISWDHPAMVALAAQHGCLLLARFLDHRDLATKIRALLDEPAALTRARAGSERARERTSADVEAQLTLDAYAYAYAQARARDPTRRPTRVRLPDLLRRLAADAPTSLAAHFARRGAGSGDEALLRSDRDVNAIWRKS